MKRDDVETHSEGGVYGRHLPAVNVKVYTYLYDYADADDVVEKFGCGKATAEKAIEWVFEIAREQFWAEIKDVVVEIFGSQARSYSAGRSGGWLVVDGLGRISGWDAVMLGKWAKLCRICREEIKYLTSKEYVFETIESNRWHEDGSEQYNFYDTREGETKCISEVKKEAKAAGFGSVVRD